MKRIAISLSVVLLASVTPAAQAIELLHYEFEQVDGSGPFTTPDSSGRGNTGTLMNMDNTNLVPGKIGNALQFNGGGDESANRVELAEDNADFDRSYPEFTFATWLKPEADGWIAGKMGFSGNRGWQLQLQPSGQLLFGYFDGPAGVEHEVFFGPDPAVSFGTWAHLAFVFKANEFVNIYVNGALSHTDTGALSALNGSNNVPLQIGNRGNSIPSSISGLMDELYVFDHALTAAEIAALVPEPSNLVLVALGMLAALWARAGRRFAVRGRRVSMKHITVVLPLVQLAIVMPSANADLLLHYKFDQVDGSAPGPFTTPDSSGRGNTGTLVLIDNTGVEPGVFGNALRYQGTDEIQDSVDAALGNPDFDRTYTELTFATWLNAENGGWIAGKMGSSGNRGWQVQLMVSGQLLFGYFDGPSGVEHEVFFGPDPSALFGTWTHLAYVFKANEFVNIYMNGELVHTDTAALSALNGVNNVPLQIGNRGNSFHNSITGLMDDVGIWDEALSGDQVALIHESGIQAPPTLLGDYNDDGTVNAADYTVWRDQLGGAIALPNETVTPGMVTIEDYDEWSTNFGAMAGGAAAGRSLSPGTVPEPSSVALYGLMIALLATWPARTWFSA